jgi:polyisoprenyl-teichoic acid--peptidoglycan teichoic acid transferase
MNWNPTDFASDTNAITQPITTSDPMAEFQPIRVGSLPGSPRRHGRVRRGCCLLWIALAGLLVLVMVVAPLAAYLLAPTPSSTFLLLGIDRPPQGTNTSRTDTIILVKVSPTNPTVRMLSIPRDLWVQIPGVGENRINTAHFFAEANQPGSGPAAAANTVQADFGIPVQSYVRIRFDGFTNVVSALGGLDVDMPSAMSGYPAGKVHLDSTQALAFARDRKGADDFFRMGHAQIIIKSIVTQVLTPSAWPRLPAAIVAGMAAVDTNIPAWEWPQLALAFLRAGSGGIDSQTLPREMTTPFVTSGGADVLLPNWGLIRPFVKDMFGS